MSEFADFIAYADESGDHGMDNIDPEYPVFTLVFCVMRKDQYVNQVVPSVLKFKFDIWGHNSVILHANDINRCNHSFSFLRKDPDLRERFFHSLNDLIKDVPMGIYASVIDKKKHWEKYIDPWNPYEVSLYFCMERLCRMLDESQNGKTVHVVFESRGAREDGKLELQFRRIAANENQWGYRSCNFRRFNFQPVFLSKKANSSGLQLADLIARPIALSYLRPNQQNRAFEAIKSKIKEVKHFP